jgi:hypothetical protein
MTTQSIDNLITFKDGKKVLLDGPLSRIFTETLNDIYAKEIEPVTGLVLESEVFQKIQQAVEFIELNKDSEEFKKANVGILYAVDSDSTITNDLAKLAGAVSVMNTQQIMNSAVIINTEDKTKEQLPICVAIEAFCSNVNIPVYKSLNSYMRSMKA